MKGIDNVMKERVLLFGKNLINIIFVCIYLIFIYCLYTFLKLQVYGNSYDFVVALGCVILFALGLLVWIIACIIFSIQKITVEFHLFPYKIEKILGILLIVISTCLFAYGIQDISAVKNEFKAQEYDDTFDVSKIMMNEKGIKIIDQKVQDIVDGKDVDLYHSHLTCDNSNRIQSFSLDLLYLNKYIYHLEYYTSQIHVKISNVSYGEESDQYPSWQTFVEKLRTITFPQTAYTVEFVSSKSDAESLYYELSSSYIKVTPEKIESDHQVIEQPQTHDSDDTSSAQTLKPDKRIGKEAGDGLVEAEYYIDKNIGYRLRCTDGATGSYFYVLDKTTNGGKNWIYWNNNPFHTEIGTSPEIGFINESVGFIKMTRAQGDYSHLYRTQDGGKSFKEVKVTDNDDYDYFTIPYIQDNKVYLKIYKHMNAIEDRYIMYISTNQGKTWMKR
ncbi:hypothetical protein [Candidatus Stoquefichus massiliensis]|uniref:hypothetical protein n=1 Tax=Candidatus Stoquefichus massiliensis TaxID=1470350 RepID=UPI00047F146B|nr:hypothetical protein [Candidatus Stoquefichus massiliensis]